MEWPASETEGEAPVALNVAFMGSAVPKNCRVDSAERFALWCQATMDEDQTLQRRCPEQPSPLVPITGPILPRSQRDRRSVTPVLRTARERILSLANPRAPPHSQTLMKTQIITKPQKESTLPRLATPHRLPPRAGSTLPPRRHIALRHDTRDHCGGTSFGSQNMASTGH